MRDTGPGEHTKRERQYGGRRVGLENTLQRLRTLYNEAYTFDIEKCPRSGLRITIRIPHRQV